MLTGAAAIIIFAALERLPNNRSLRIASAVLVVAGAAAALAGHELGFLACLLGIVALLAGLLEDASARRTPEPLEPERHDGDGILPSTLPGTRWTRADALRSGDHIYMRNDGQNQWGLITDAQPGDDTVHLQITILQGDVVVGQQAQHPTVNSHYMRRLDPDVREQVPQTTAAGLEHALDTFQGDWVQHGITNINLPTPVADQLLLARGWQIENDQLERAWCAPTGEVLWGTDETLAFALVAEATRAR